MNDPETISSASNSLLKRARRLIRSAKARREESAFVVEGLNGVETLIKKEQTRLQIDTIFVSNSFHSSPDGKRIISGIDNEKIRIVDDDLLARVADARTSQGLMAIARMPQDARVAEKTSRRQLLLDRISDPGNMGTIIRTAVGLGIEQILLHGDCVDVYNPKCVRSTAGMLPFVNIGTADISTLQKMLSNGFELVCAERGNGCSINDWKPSDRCILAVGSEAHGISEEIGALATDFVNIPLEPICESLNASVAAGILMQRMSQLCTE